MPVRWPNGSLKNTVLHIQSPNEEQKTIIRHFSKRNTSMIDPIYDAYNFKACNYTSQSDPDSVLSDTKLTQQDNLQHI